MGKPTGIPPVGQPGAQQPPGGIPGYTPGTSPQGAPAIMGGPATQPNAPAQPGTPASLTGPPPGTGANPNLMTNNKQPFKFPGQQGPQGP